MADKNIDKLFKQKLQAHSQSPRAEAWDKLSAALGEEKGGTRKIPLMWIMSVAAALFLALTVGSYWLQNPNGIQGGNNVADTQEDSLKGIKKQKLQDLPLGEENNTPQMVQEESLKSQQQQENESELMLDNKLPNEKNNQGKKKSSEKKEFKKTNQKEKLKELDEIAPLLPKQEDKTVLANNTNTQNDDKENEVFRIVVRVSLSKETAAPNTQVASNKNTKKPKSKIGKVLNAIKDFKEGENSNDSLDVENERLWASIGKK